MLTPFFFFFFNFILKFICCQFAACLFFGISLIKYFLFSPLSPWLLTLLPTLTIVCCGKFLLVEFFFFFFAFSSPFPSTPLFIFGFSLWKSQFHFTNKLCQQQGAPRVSQEEQHCQLQAWVAPMPLEWWVLLLLCWFNKCWILHLLFIFLFLEHTRWCCLE